MSAYLNSELSDRVVVTATEFAVLPVGGGGDESTRLFGTGGIADAALNAGKPLVLNAGTYYVANDVTLPAGLVIRMQLGAVFSVAATKTLDATLAVVETVSSTWYGGAGTVTVPDTTDDFAGNVSIVGDLTVGGALSTADVTLTGTTNHVMAPSDKTTNAAAGISNTVRGQNETGTGSTGGAMAIAGGTGTLVGGACSVTGGAVAATGTGGAASCTGGVGTTAGGAATLGGGAGTTTGGAANVYTGDGVTKGLGTLRSGGAAGTVRLSWNGTGLGFYATPPIALQTGVAVTIEAVHAALVALGAFTA